MNPEIEKLLAANLGGLRFTDDQLRYVCKLKDIIRLQAETIEELKPESMKKAS